VKVGAGDQSASAGSLLPGKGGKFRLAQGAKGDSLQLAKLWAKEDDRITSRWASPVEHAGPVGRTAITQEGRLQNQQIEAGWSAQEGKLQFKLISGGGRPALCASLEASVDGSPVSFSAWVVEPNRVILSGRYEQGSLECNLEALHSALRLTFRNFRNGLHLKENASAILALRLRPELVTFRFMPAYVYSNGLAAQTAFRLTGDELFRRFAGAARTIGWWIVRENGRDVWPQKAASSDIGGPSGRSKERSLFRSRSRWM